MSHDAMVAAFYSANWSDVCFWLTAAVLFLMLNDQRMSPGGVATSFGAGLTSIVTQIFMFTSTLAQLAMFVVTSTLFFPIAVRMSRRYDFLKFNNHD